MLVVGFIAAMRVPNRELFNLPFSLEESFSEPSRRLRAVPRATSIFEIEIEGYRFRPAMILDPSREVFGHAYDDPAIAFRRGNQCPSVVNQELRHVVLRILYL